MIRTLSIALVALFAGLSGAALAQGPGSFAQYQPGGTVIRLDANYYASDTCQAALAANRAVPPGQHIAQNIIPVTIVIGPNPKGCGGKRVVRRIVSVTGPVNTELIQIFFVTPQGRILKVEKVAIAYY